MVTSVQAKLCTYQWLQVSVGLGLLAWLALAVGSALADAWVGTITLLFLLAPLVIVPLALEVIANFAGSEPPPGSERLARRLQPAGAVLAAASFAFSPGVTAAVIASGWLLVCGLLTLSGVLRMLRSGYRSLEELCFAIALVYITIGGIAARAC